MKMIIFGVFKVQSAYELETILTQIEASQPVDEKIPVIGMFWMCSRFQNYFDFTALDLNCDYNRYPDAQDGEQWREVNTAMQTYAERNE